MSYKLEIYSSSTWYDVSSYVVSCSAVPIISRNINFEPNADGFDFAVSASYNSGTIGNNTRLNGATYIRFGTGGVVYFLGKVRKKKLDYQNHIYEYTIVNALIDLDDYYIDAETLDSTIIGTAASGAGESFTVNAGSDYIVDNGHGYTTPTDDGTPIVFTGSGSNDEIDKNVVYFIDVIDANNFEIHLDQGLSGAVDLVDTTTTNMTYHEFDHNFNPYDNQGFPNLRLSHLVDCMFEVAGLDTLAGTVIDKTGLSADTVIESKKVYETGTSDTPGTRDFTFGDMRIDKEMLYCLNQTYAISSAKITSNDISEYDTGSRKITFWEFLRQLCSLFQLVIYYNDGYQLRRNTSEGTYSITDAATYGYEKESIPARLQDYRWIINAGSDPTGIRVPYDTSADSLTELYRSYGKSEQALDWMDHLIILCEGKWSGAGNTDVYELDSDGQHALGYNFVTPLDAENSNSIGEALSDEASLSYTKEIFLTAASTTFQNVVLNEIDPLNQTSKIIEVTW